MRRSRLRAAVSGSSICPCSGLSSFWILHSEFWIPLHSSGLARFDPRSKKSIRGFGSHRLSLASENREKILPPTSGGLDSYCLVPLLRGTRRRETDQQQAGGSQYL